LLLREHNVLRPMPERKGMDKPIVNMHGQEMSKDVDRFQEVGLAAIEPIINKVKQPLPDAAKPHLYHKNSVPSHAWLKTVAEAAAAKKDAEKQKAVQRRQAKKEAERDERLAADALDQLADEVQAEEAKVEEAKAEAVAAVPAASRPSVASSARRSAPPSAQPASGSKVLRSAAKPSVSSKAAQAAASSSAAEDEETDEFSHDKSPLLSARGDTGVDLYTPPRVQLQHQGGGRAGTRSSTRRRDYEQRVLVGVAVERENQSALEQIENDELYAEGIAQMQPESSRSQSSRATGA
jgi:hypothetical protein